MQRPNFLIVRMPLDPSVTSLAVFAPGLLGGSILLKARALGFRELRVWARRKETCEAALAKSLATMASNNAAEVAEGADMLFLCAPVEAMPDLARAIACGKPAAHAIITDVGSVKEMVMREVAPVFDAAGLCFIGSHPIAGGSKGGMEEARADLFAHAPCILTPSGETPPAALARLGAFWAALGCSCSMMTPELHDRVVARVSHLPHIAAALTTLAAFQPDPGYAQYSGGGLRDTTRVAGGSPDMWRGILMNNREAVLPVLRDFLTEGHSLLAMLEREDGPGVEKLLARAKALHATRYT